MKMENFMKIGKTIVIKGTQAVTVTAGVVVIQKLVTEGIDGVKNIQLDDLLKK